MSASTAPLREFAKNLRIAQRVFRALLQLRAVRLGVRMVRRGVRQNPIGLVECANPNPQRTIDFFVQRRHKTGRGIRMAGETTEPVPVPS